MRKFPVLFLAAILVPLLAYAADESGKKSQFPLHAAGLDITRTADYLFLRENCGCFKMISRAWPGKDVSSSTIMVSEDYCKNPRGDVPPQIGPYCSQLAGNYTYFHSGSTGRVWADAPTERKMEAARKLITGAK